MKTVNRHYDFFSLFRHFIREYNLGKLTRDQLKEKWQYSQMISGIKPVERR